MGPFTKLTRDELYVYFWLVTFSGGLHLACHQYNSSLIILLSKKTAHFSSNYLLTLTALPKLQIRAGSGSRHSDPKENMGGWRTLA